MQTAFPNLVPRRALQDISPPLWEIVSLLGSVLSLGLLQLAGLYEAINIAGPLLLATIAGLANWNMVRRNPTAIWTPLFSFRLGVLVFLAFGALVPYLVSDPLVDRIKGLYPYTEQEAAKVNLLWFIYATLIVGAAKLASAFRGSETPVRLGELLEGWTTAKLGILFFAVGISYSLLIDLPRQLELFLILVPGSLSLVFLAANSVGTFLITYHALQKGGAWYLLAAFILLLQIALGLVLYNKSMILLPILLSSLAMLFDRVTLPRVVGITVMLVTALNLLQPAVRQARDLHLLSYGSESGGTTGGTIGERMSNITSLWTDGPLRENESGEGLLRLSYLNIGTFMVTEYDVGLPGNSIQAATYALIPRFIWPQKPVVTDAGRELYYRITGEATSFLAPTTAADLYWNMGWAGILLLTPVLGVFLWAATLASYSIVSAQDWFMMPFVLIAFLIGLGTDQGFVVGIFVPAVAALIAFFFLRFAKAFVSLGTAPPLRRPPPGTGARRPR